MRQKQAIQAIQSNKYDSILFGGAAGGGKSYLGCIFLATNCIRYPGSRWFLGRDTLKDLKQSALLTLFEVFAMMDMKKGKHYTYSSQDGLVKLKNGSEVYLIEMKFEPSDPEFDKFGSKEYCGGFIEEAQETTLKAFDVIQTRVRYKLKELGLIGTVLLSCNPDKGWLFREFYEPNKNGELEPERLFIKSLPTDNPFLPATYIRKLNKIKDEATKQRLLYGNWEYEEVTNQLVLYQWMEAAKTDVLPPNTVGMSVGVDLAREGKDKSIIALWHGKTLVDLSQIDVPITDQANISGLIGDKILDYAKQRGFTDSDTHLDAIGVGAGVIDYLRGKGFMAGSYKGGESVDTKEAEFTQYSNLRTYSYWQFREGVQDGTIKVYKDIPFFSELVRDFTAHTYSINDKVIVLEKKAKVKQVIGRSPDYSDAAVIGYAPQPKLKFSFAFSK